MSLSPGVRVGPYEIIAEIGAGGMGEVYRARDTLLSRDVALKVLPAAFAGDADRLARFTREAQTLAALNHPNIAAIYGLEKTPDLTALVMELVEGEDLSAVIARGALPLGDALPVAAQIADALEAAHEQGIIHRDLKPANVKVRADGTVKVLDFGLAKAMDPAGASSADARNSPTLTSPAMTAMGTLLGTAAYMAPEQARGKAVDKRADIWAFGVVLFEMLTGKRLFDGETVSDVLASVLTLEPGWSALPPTTPGSCGRLLRRCLERNPRQRLRDIGEARIALESTDTAGAVPGPANRFRGPVIAALFLALAAAGFLAGWWLRPSPAVMRKVDISDELLKGDSDFAPVLSPNGERILYFTGDGVRVRELDQAGARTVVGSDGVRRAFWSPDGREIGFFKDEGLHRVALGGGAPQLIARTGPIVGGAGACWGVDGRIVYSLGNTGLFEVSARGGEPRVLLAPDPARGEDHFHGCAFLPDSRAFVWVIHPIDSPADTLALFENGRTRVLLRLPSEEISLPSFSPSGHIVFERRGAGQDGVWALPFSLSRLEPTGEPFLIASGAMLPSAAADGSLLYVPPLPRRTSRLVWVSRSGQREGTAVEFPDALRGIALSRDGKRVAAAVADGGGSDIWVANLERGSRSRLTSGAGARAGQAAASAPAWSPDGTRIAFAQNNQILVVPADGSSPARVVGRGLQPFFSADGRTILAHRTHVESPRTRYEIVSLGLKGESEPSVVLRDSVSVRYPLLSPDGRFLAYDRGDGDEVESFLTLFPKVEGRWQVSATGGTFLRWAPDGRRLFYFAPTTGKSDEGLFEVEVRHGEKPSLGVPRLLFTLSSAQAAAQEYEVGPSGNRFLMIARSQDDSLARLVLVQHWFAEFH